MNGAVKVGVSHPKGKKAVPGLTQREQEIISLVVLGYTNKQIGQEFSISENTVKHHLTSIYNKLGIRSRVELVVSTIQRQLVEIRKPPQKTRHGTMVPFTRKRKAA